ncbi:GTP-binding protein HflX [Streptococcus pneumoniae]|nr:GTP-binding protein HflX [Streptococcus pneumoniae]
MIETEKKEERVLLIGVELQGMDSLTSPWKNWLV